MVVTFSKLAHQNDKSKKAISCAVLVLARRTHSIFMVSPSVGMTRHLLVSMNHPRVRGAS